MHTYWLEPPQVPSGLGVYGGGVGADEAVEVWWTLLVVEEVAVLPSHAPDWQLSTAHSACVLPHLPAKEQQLPHDPPQSRSLNPRPQRPFQLYPRPGQLPS